jgi:hypothetical protein
MLCFLANMQLLVEEANKYYHQYSDTLDEEHIPLPDMTILEVCFLYYCAYGAWLLARTEIFFIDTKILFTSFYSKGMMRQIFSYAEISTRYWQQKWT